MAAGENVIMLRFVWNLSEVFHPAHKTTDLVLAMQKIPINQYNITPYAKIYLHKVFESALMPGIPQTYLIQSFHIPAFH